MAHIVNHPECHPSFISPQCGGAYVIQMFSTWPVRYWQCSTITTYLSCECACWWRHTHLWRRFLGRHHLSTAPLFPDRTWARVPQPTPTGQRAEKLFLKSSVWSSQLWPLIKTLLQILQFNWRARECDHINFWDNPVFNFFFPID